jgi:hypothetical protein
MAADFAGTFAALKSVLEKHESSFAIKTGTSAEYTLVSKLPSPFKQHKGEPMFFASVRLGKGYVGFHLMPLYMCPPLIALISPALKKRMQGKTCFNFKTVPEPELLADLTRLTEAGFTRWSEQKWV